MPASSPSAIAARKSPSLARIFFLVLAALAGLCSRQAQAEGLTEADVTRLAREHNPQAAVHREKVAASRAREQQAGLRGNPQLAWQREHLTSASESEDSLVVNVPLNRSRQQTVSQMLARVGVAQAQGAAAMSQSEAVQRALELFYRCLAQREQIAIDNDAWERLAEATRIVMRRREEGRLSGYDLARVELETELARSEVQEARTVEASLHRELALLLGMPEATLDLSGSLQPSAGLEDSADANESPAMTALRAAAGLANDASRRADRTWRPTVSLTAGLRIAHAEDTEYGYVAGLAFDIPLWNRGRALRTKAEALGRLATAQVSAAKVERARRSASAREMLRGLRAEAERFDRATVARVAALQRAAESGYREGQRNLVELLDASRTQTSVRARQLTLAFAIKQAEIALRASRGEFE